MKFLIVALAFAAVASAQQYGGQHQQQAQEPIPILRQSQDVAPDGSYNYQYETGNGISASESGAQGAPSQDGEGGTVASGQFSYTADDGTPIQVTYTADENGFQAQGAHLPVAPAVPEAIARALEYNAAHPEQDDQHQQQQPQQQQFNRRF